MGFSLTSGSWGDELNQKGSARHPPLACRPSPPQGGRSAVGTSPPIDPGRRLAKADVTANLPP
ncbi:hypothetical protein FJ980_28095 [Mesorhizobium sp. B1-1-5]|nr:hypothetical protein FJ980_28095 [Mesorhizobium sp. B1-1-5]